MLYALTARFRNDGLSMIHRREFCFFSVPPAPWSSLHSIAYNLSGRGGIMRGHYLFRILIISVKWQASLQDRNSVFLYGEEAVFFDSPCNESNGRKKKGERKDPQKIFKCRFGREQADSCCN